MKTDSGKLLIVAMVGAGVLAAGASWWFRFSATHRAAQFWGNEAASLIRDASNAEVLSLQLADDAAAEGHIEVAGAAWQITDSQDVSRAPGLTHLRHALLEDRSFRWPAQDVPVGATWSHGLRFRSGPNPPLTILFASDYTLMTRLPAGDGAAQAVICAPIAAGLEEVFRDWTQPVTRPADSPATDGDR
ncbi:MAG: hypothetical protein WEH44_01925 [Pirellulaceae bacterium]